ncbi:MAG: hypothetical protein ACJ8M1_10160 [Chthoniobacterales bacterium]
MSESSSLSFREKSAWVSLAVLLVVYVPYFCYLWTVADRGLLNIGTAIGLFIAALFFQIVLAVVAQIVISVRAKIDPKDERDAAIDGKAFRNAYFVLTAAICCAALFVTVVSLANGPGAGIATAGHVLSGFLSPAAATQILLSCLVIGEIVKYGTQVFCYRRGA